MVEASDIIKELLGIICSYGLRVYLLIDEYDNFANELLSSGDEATYKRLAQGTGFLKTFFKQIKVYTQQGPGIVARAFITGVTPMLLDDLGSGFNSAEKVTMEKSLNEIMGFTEQEVMELLKRVAAEQPKIDPQRCIEKIRTHYNGYRFTEYADTRVYNSTMVIYFCNKLLRLGKPPAPVRMYDPNIKTDYSKIKLLITVDKKLQRGSRCNGNYSVLKRVVEDKGISCCVLSMRFRIDEIPQRDNFISLLYYLGSASWL